MPQTKSVETSTTKNPASEYEMRYPGFEKGTIEEGVPVTADDGEVIFVDAPLAGTIVDTSVPVKDEESPPVQVEERSSIYIYSASANERGSGG